MKPSAVIALSILVGLASIGLLTMLWLLLMPSGVLLAVMA